MPNNAWYPDCERMPTMVDVANGLVSQEEYNFYDREWERKWGNGGGFTDRPFDPDPFMEDEPTEEELAVARGDAELVCDSPGRQNERRLEALRIGVFAPLTIEGKFHDDIPF